MKYIFPTLAFLLATQPALSNETAETQAEEPPIAAAKPTNKKFYFGIRAGTHQDNLPNKLGALGGLVAGYGSFKNSIELDFHTSTYTLDDNQCLRTNLDNCTPDMSYNVGGFYAVSRHIFSSYPSTYGKFRLGIVEQSLSLQEQNNGLDSNTITSAGWGFSAGLGLGYTIADRYLLELDYTKVDADVSSISITASTRF